MEGMWLNLVAAQLIYMTGLSQGIGCIAPYTRLVTGCYLFSNVQGMNWWQASESCRMQGGELAMVESYEEAYTLKNYIRSRHARTFWVGGYDHGHEGRWHWEMTKMAVYFNDWASGQPDNGGLLKAHGPENCMALHKERDFKWDDMPCNQELPFVCEKISPQCLQRPNYGNEGFGFMGRAPWSRNGYYY